MPTLRGFDEEFGQAAGVTQLDRTRSILLAVALGAAILGGLTLAWLAVVKRRPELPPSRHEECPHPWLHGLG